MTLTSEQYHARPHMSATKLKNFLKSPAHYKAALELTADTPASRFGRMCHSFILEPKEFDATYEPFDLDRRTKAGKAEWARIQEAGLEPIKPEKLDTMIDMRHAIGSLIPAGDSEVTFEAVIEGVECQCRVDRIDALGRVYDLKTCQDITAVDRVFYSYGYDIQTVFYQMVMDASGHGFGGMEFIFVEKTAPHDVAVREMDLTVRAPVERQIREALKRFRDCRAKDYWPGFEGGDLSCKVATAPAWRTSEMSPDLDLSGFYSTANEAC